MKTKMIIAVLICMITGQLVTVAQDFGQGRPDPEQMMQMSADRMAKELALDDATTAAFTEIYKAYLTEKFALMSQYGGMRGPRPQEVSAENGRGRKHEAQNEESAAEQIIKNFERRQKQIELQQKQLALDIQYCEKFNKVLNPKQILKLYESQNNFGRPMGGQYGAPNGHGGQRPQARGGFQGGRPGGGWPGTSDDWNE